MLYIEKLRQYKHSETYLELIEDYKKLIINIKHKESGELRIKLEVNKDDEEMLEKICGVLKYYEFSEHRDINSMHDFKDFIEKHNYYIGFRKRKYVFVKYFMNGAIKMFSKNEIESIHKVNINAI